MTTADWCSRWSCPLLEEIPIPGPATAKDWRGCGPGTTRYPGRNHPRVGAWLIERYFEEFGVMRAADPMIGAGGLWIAAVRRPWLKGCDVDERALPLVRHNMSGTGREFVHARAEEWVPSWGLSPFPDTNLVMFSPPFRQNHSAGATEHQREMRDRKHLHVMQEFSGSPPDMLAVYRRIRTYCRGFLVVILRNRIHSGVEVDEIGCHIGEMRASGFQILGAHPRDLVRPTGYQQWKLARNPDMAWIRTEWAVVATTELVGFGEMGAEC